MDKSQEKTTDTNERPKGAFPAVPTTKVLAIGRLVAPLTPEQRKAILPREVPDTVRLFLAARSTNGGLARMEKAPSSS